MSWWPWKRKNGSETVEAPTRRPPAPTRTRTAPEDPENLADPTSIPAGVEEQIHYCYVRLWFAKICAYRWWDVFGNEVTGDLGSHLDRLAPTFCGLATVKHNVIGSFTNPRPNDCRECLERAERIANRVRPRQSPEP